MAIDQNDENVETDSPELLDQEKLRDIIREELGSILPDFLEGAETEEIEVSRETTGKASTNKDIEAEITRQVTEAMAALQAAKPKKAAAPRTSAPKKAEVEEAPSTPGKKFDLSKILWGGN